MGISQNIYDYIELSKITGQPILLISNPGYGKTTSITNWAKEKGYHYEQLIGSRFSPDDILGYQINEPGKPCLVQKDPIWFKRIIDAESEGRPTVLFVDEISTCSDAVQGSLLSLIFDRRIGNGKELPADCIIIAAANYSENLPSFMNIMAPTINRFCVVNLLMGYNNNEILQECLNVQHPKTRTANEVDEEEIVRQFNEMINGILLKYSHVDATTGYIDLQNHDIANIYKRRGNVYNIMSWRSITYLRNFVIGMAKLGISDMNIVKNICGGMIGLGSNNFKTDDQVETFIQLVSKEVKGIIELNNKNGIHNFKPISNKISEVVNEYFRTIDDTNNIITPAYESGLVDFINSKLGDWNEVFNTLNKANKMEKMQFINDMDSIALLIPKLSSENAAKVADIHQSCSSMYSDIIGVETDFSEKLYGIYTPSIIKRCILAKDSEGKVRRLGVFGATGGSYVVIPNSMTVKNATLSKIIKPSNFEKLTITKD